MLSTLSFEYQNPKITSSLKQTTKFMRIDEIDQELNTIFQIPQTLSRTKQRELYHIMSKMDKIHIKNFADEVEDIYNQIDSIYTNDEITPTQKQTLSTLEKQLNRLFKYDLNNPITIEDEEKLDQLNREIDALYEVKEPTIQELTRAGVLFCEKKMLSASS